MKPRWDNLIWLDGSRARIHEDGTRLDFHECNRVWAEVEIYRDRAGLCIWHEWESSKLDSESICVIPNLGPLEVACLLIERWP